MYNIYIIYIYNIYLYNRWKKLWQFLLLLCILICPPSTLFTMLFTILSLYNIYIYIYYIYIQISENFIVNFGRITEFRENHRKLYGNCAFPQIFHTRKLGEITVFYAVQVRIKMLSRGVFRALRSFHSGEPLEK